MAWPLFRELPDPFSSQIIGWNSFFPPRASQAALEVFFTRGKRHSLSFLDSLSAWALGALGSEGWQRRRQRETVL